MAGMGRSRGTRAPGRSSVDDRSWPVTAEASAVVSGSGTGTGAGTSKPVLTAARLSPEARTRATFRLLLMRGLAPDEAAALTAFVSGIPIAGQAWSLTEINQLLFLRGLRHTGRFGESDGRPSST